ncbi:MAG: sulfite exporter TauE/SafE family protein [Ruminococcus sp.]|nr:sulfite exporter TauE/SafE family protein [Ruminococcus sp.]
MDLIIIGIVSFLSGIMASMGLGGGMVLILYLSAINGLDQLSSQGINLLFFIPIGIFSVILHSKRKLIKWKFVLLPLITGGIAVSIFSFIATKINADMLKTAFGVFIIAVGIITFFKKNKNP